LEAVFSFLATFRYFLTKKLGNFLIAFFSSVKWTKLGKISPNFRHENFEKKTLVGREWECVCVCVRERERERGSNVDVACG
jgi:hypothetical protein